MKKALTIILIGIIILTMVFCTGCNAKKTVEETQATTEVTTQTAEASIQAEVDAYYASREELNQKACELIEKVSKEATMDEELLDDIESVQTKLDMLKASSRKTLSPEAYEELYYEIELYGWEPVIYANQRFYLKPGFFLHANWSQNVIIDEDNGNVELDRIYYLKDESKPGYLLLKGVETPQRLVIILPGTQIY